VPGNWCLAPIQGGGLLAILAGATGAWQGQLVPGTDSRGRGLLAILAGATGAWHRIGRRFASILG